MTLEELYKKMWKSRGTVNRCMVDGCDKFSSDYVIHRTDDVTFLCLKHYLLYLKEWCLDK